MAAGDKVRFLKLRTAPTAKQGSSRIMLRVSLAATKTSVLQNVGRIKDYLQIFQLELKSIKKKTHLMIKHFSFTSRSEFWPV